MTAPSFLVRGTFFFTVVTYHRRPILTTEVARPLLHLAWKNTVNRFPFETKAICLLPNHLHCIWTLPPGDSNYSIRWSEIKRLFTQAYLSAFAEVETRNESHIKRGEATLWQRRFWTHLIIDETDLRTHMDYIHFNPVKHGLVKNVSDWPWSSFHRLVNLGLYEKHWGSDLSSKFSNLSLGE